ncbi:MAG: 4Fe-4S binding protein [Lachnospiraceae bacterium]
MRVDQAKCVGCYACVVACVDAHYDADDENWISYRIPRKYIDSFGIDRFVPDGCTHCGKCVEVCLQGAITRDEEFSLIVTNTDKCTGCGACYQACPFKVIQIAENGIALRCDGCIGRRVKGRDAACARVCPVKAIAFDNQN